MSVNRVVLIGRLTRDPEARATSTGMSVAEFSIAVDKKKRNDGEKEANFFKVKCFGRSADFVTQYLTKGRLVAIDGRLEHRTWEKDGQKRETIEIIADDVQGLDRPREDEPSKPKNILAEDDGDPFDE